MWAALLGSVFLAALPPAADLPERCVDDHGMTSTIGVGRDRAVRKLFAPYTQGSVVAGGWTLGEHDVSGARVQVSVARGSDTATLILAPRACPANAEAVTASFSLAIRGPPAATPALELLAAAVQRNDRGGFYTSRVLANPADDEKTPPWSDLPLHQTVAVYLILILLALIAVASDLRGVARDVGLSGRGARRVRWALAAIVLAGAVWRLLVEPAFIHEVYLPPVGWLSHGLSLADGVSHYPQGAQLVPTLLGPLLSGDTFHAWFAANQLLGMLTVPVAFLAVAALTRSPQAGLVGAALFAAWPLHIRISASEILQVQFGLVTLLGVALVALAATGGRLRTFAAAAFTAGWLVTLRPEAAVVVPLLAVIAVGHGPGVRTQWRSVGRWLILALVGLAVWPTVVAIATSQNAAFIVEGADGRDDVGLASVTKVLETLVAADERNVFLNPAVSPIWIYLMAGWGLLAGWLARARTAVTALVALGVSLLLVYSSMPPETAPWPLVRYQSGLFPVVGCLAAFGLWDLLGRVGWLRRGDGWRRVVAGAAVAVAALVYWPAVQSLAGDLQVDRAFALEVGRAHRAELMAPDVRIVTIDNRRRFRDLSPRDSVPLLTNGRITMDGAWTVAHAFQGLAVGDGQPPAFFYWGRSCWLAVAPGEPVNPQCAAMKEAFELELVASRVTTAASYLTMYAGREAPAPHELALYRVVARKLEPAPAAALLPQPLEPDPSLYPMASNSAPQMEPPR